MLVATYNAHRGLVRGGRFRPERILEVVAEIGPPDLVALQEAQHWLRPERPMFDARAIEVLGLRPLPVRERPRDQGWRGNVLLVRRDARLPEPPVGLRLGGMEPRGAILAVLDLGEGPFRVIGTHLSLGGGTRRRQARALLEAMEHGPGRGLPTLLMGDLNEWGRRGALAVLAPAFGGMPPRAPTFPAFRPLASLDRILGRPAGIVARLRVHDTRLAREASDHLPLTARVELGGRAAAARLDGRAEGAETAACPSSTAPAAASPTG